jgi:hypothetical protein
VSLLPKSLAPMSLAITAEAMGSTITAAICKGPTVDD